MNDAQKIFELYVENAVAKEQPTMTQYASGTKKWYLHGELHRENAPAIEWEDGTKEWFLHGKMHREDGPAFEDPNAGCKAWWLHNVHYKTAEQWAEALLRQRNEPHDEAMVDAFLKTILRKDAAEAL